MEKSTFNFHLVTAPGAGLGQVPFHLSVSPGQLCSLSCFCGMSLVCAIGELAEASRQICPGLAGD